MIKVLEDKSWFGKASYTLRQKKALSFLFVFLLIIGFGVTYYEFQTPQDMRNFAAYDSTSHTFSETFDGTPTSPQPFTNLMQNTWDIAVHSRDGSTWQILEAMEAHHGPDCSAPLDANGNLITHHDDGTYDNAVFKCKDHIMTAINAGGYGVIYLTPAVLADFSNGPTTIKFDVSTLRTTNRDWIDIFISPYEDNMQLPLEGWLPDLQGLPKNGIHIRMDNFGVSTTSRYPSGFRVSVVRDYQETEITQDTWDNYDSILTPSPKDRTTFELILSQNHVKFGIPPQTTTNNKSLYWADVDINPPLTWNMGVVQLGHHSYNPNKACDFDGTCPPNTWHWDNVSISPAVPFTMIKGNRRYTDPANDTIVFNSPAPANANLRFSGTGIIQVSFDNGATWQDAGKQLGSSQVAGQHHAEHFSSYWMPIPAGATNTKFRFSNDTWYEGPFEAKDIDIWSLDTNITPFPTNTPTPPSPTPTPLPAGSSLITIGDTNVESTADTGNGNTLLAQKATLTTPATLQSLSFFVTNAVGNLRMGVYDATGPGGGPGQKIAETNVSTPTTGWNTSAVTTPVLLPAGTYWLAYLPSSSSLAFVKNPNGAGAKFYSYAFGALPQTFSTASSSTPSNWSLYATLLTNGNSSVPTNTPTPTLIPTATPIPTSTPIPTPSPTIAPSPTPSFIPGDINHDNKVDVQDLSYILSHWNTNDTLSDLNKDGKVGILDLSILLANWKP